MQEEQFSPEQSLQLIREMISKTKQDIADNGIHFLVWGWITFIACCMQFVLKRIVGYEYHYLAWSTVFIGIIFTLSYGRKTERKHKARTYIGDNMKNLWIGMALSFLVLSIICTHIGWGSTVFPFFILLYGLGTFLSGNILEYRPLQVGGILAWLIAIGSLYLEYDYQILTAALAILVSYIIPAYLFRFRNKLATKQTIYDTAG